MVVHEKSSHYLHVVISMVVSFKWSIFSQNGGFVYFLQLHYTCKEMSREEEHGKRPRVFVFLTES